MLLDGNCEKRPYKYLNKANSNKLKEFIMAYPHVEWLDLKNDGINVECAVMKRDSNGNIYHFQLAALDAVDKQRLRNILTGRNARNFPLWDLMQQVTLGNGVNALEYFHQLVKVKTPSGQIIDPVQGRMGAAKPQGLTREQQAAQQAAQAPTQVTENVGNVDNRTPAEKRAATIAAKKSQ
jgi:hypothetical protein